MAKIFPFRGIRYNTEKTGELSNLVCQPYDKIDDALMHTYYVRDPHNFTRIVRAEVEPNEPDNNRYTRAHDFITDWLGRGVFERDHNPSIYVYHQRYRAEGQVHTRKGFIALAAAERFGEGVKAHELTLEEPKLDRLKLMRATFANIEPIFMLYSDPEVEVNRLLAEAIAGREPDMSAKDDMGEEHLLWVVENPEVCAGVAERMADKVLFIADGHHRYETACNFYDEKKAEGYVCEGDENIGNVMLTMINMDEPGLTVLPTHRLIFGVEDFDYIRFLTQVRMYFDVTTLHFDDHGGEAGARDEMFAMMDSAADKKTVFGYYASGQDAYEVLAFNNPELMDKMLSGDFSADYKKLDAAILHATLHKWFCIDDEALKAESNVHYVRGRDEAIRRVNNDSKYQCCFLMNPTRVDDVKRVAMQGERMPQKSTDFYPKLLSGMVFNKMNCRMGSDSK